MIDEEKEDYKEKDIVWVKAKGHPWWPSIINHISFRNIQTNGENIKEKIYSIEFIGEKNNFKVTKEKIEPFYKNYDQHINTKNHLLIKSIELAEKTIEKKQNSKIISLKENNQDTVNDKKDNEKDIDNINDQNIPTKKNHESSEEKSIGEKDSDKNIFLQKKRMNEAIILDENKGENNNKKNIDIKNKEEKKLIPSPKNNIKINININLTTNNRNMVNINSFHSSDTLNQNNANNKNNLIPNINYSPLSTIEKNNFNKTQNNPKEIKNILNSDEESIEDFEKRKNKEDNNIKNEGKNNSKNESIEEENETEEENENDEMITNDEINEIMKKLLNGQIQMSNISSQKMIITELNQLSEKLNELFAKNQDLEIYNLTKYLIPILITFTYNKNNDILIKSSEILSFLNEKIINEIFILTQKEKDNLIELGNNEEKEEKDKAEEKVKENYEDKELSVNEIEERDFKEGLNIIEMINQKNINKSNFSEHHISYSKRGRPKKNSNNSDISSEFFSSKLNEGIFSFKDTFNFNEKNVYDEFMKIISCKDKDKMENDFKELSNNFFNNIYDKNNNDLDGELAKIRKQLCIKIFKMVHKILPEIKTDFLKKVIVYFEYRIRNDNSNEEKIYSNKINSLYEIIKERLYDKIK